LTEGLPASITTVFGVTHLHFGIGIEEACLLEAGITIEVGIASCLDDDGL
jgi:hypothetical protein